MSIIKNLVSKILKLIDFFISPLDVVYLVELKKHINHCSTIIDLGCGPRSPLRKIKKEETYALGVDIFEKYIEISKKRKIHDDYLLLNILNIDDKISPKSYDCVLLLDVLEHLTILDGIKLIKTIEKIARKKIIIFTPNGFLEQPKYHNNIYQVHLSGWNVKLLRKMGFKIYGIEGLKFIRGIGSIIKYRPFEVWVRISKLSKLFVKYFPQFAFELLCIKEFG